MPQKTKLAPKPDEHLRPLAALAKEIGDPDPAQVEAFLAGTSDAELVDVGRTIRTPRVLTDTARLYGQAWEFWQQATAEQKKRLRGFSAPLLAMAVQQAILLEKMNSAHEAKKDDADKTRAQGERSAAAALSEGLALRDQAFDALLDAAVHEDALVAEVGGAKGTAEDGDALARGLDGLAGVLRGWLTKAKRDKGLRGRLQLGSLNAAFAEELSAAASNVRSASALAQKRPAGGKVTQGQLDRADGINVLLLGRVIRAFEGAHTLDPTIPRLLPISTRHLFSHKAKKKEVAGEGVGSGKGKKKEKGGEAAGEGAEEKAPVKAPK